MRNLEVKNVYKTYRKAGSEVQALRGVSLQMEEGEFVAIVGESGSGKSTLLQCAAGLDFVDSGIIEIGGKSIVGISDAALTKIRRESAGFVFQAYNLLPTKTVRENILYPLKLQNRKADSRLFEQITRKLSIDDLLERYPSFISGGQQQRVAVARSLISKPALIFADEPTGALDTKSSGALLQLLREAVDDYRQSVLMVTHDMAAAAYADRIIHMRDGQIIKEETGRDRERTE